MYKYYTTAALLLLSLFVISCSAPQKAAKSSGAKSKTEVESIYPGWYSTSTEFVATDSTFTAYGIALAADSTTAVQKAVDEAKSNFERYLSSRLESIRDNAQEELGNSSGVGNPSFIFTLRNAEASLSGAVTVGQKQAEPNKGFKSYQGFASVTITRENLISSLSDQLNSSEQEWRALRTSQAFQEF